MGIYNPNTVNKVKCFNDILFDCVKKPKSGFQFYT